MSTENAVLQQIMEQTVKARQSYMHSLKTIWMGKETLELTLQLKEELMAQGLEASVETTLMSVGMISLTIQLGSGHSITRDILPLLEERLEGYELQRTHKEPVRGEVELRYVKVVKGYRISLSVTILTGKSSTCRWIPTGKFIELTELVCDEDQVA